MRCDLCNGNMETKYNQEYHYKRCGLDNIYLQNIKAEQCQSCGVVSPYISRMPELHKVIAFILVLKEAPLTGKEIRFLRKERRLKAKDWATMLEVDAQTMSRWENQVMPPSGTIDKFIRVLWIRIFEEQEGKRFKKEVVKHFLMPKPAAQELPDIHPAVYIDTSNLEQYNCATA